MVNVVIYADVIFAINFLMDLIILWSVSYFAKKHLRGKLYLVLAAALMALSSCFGFFTAGILKILLSVVTVFAGVFTAFKINNIFRLLIVSALMYIAAFFIGGLTLFLFLNVKSFSILLLVSSASLFYISFSAVKYIFRHLPKQKILNVSISFQEREVILPMLVDTGNSLSEPVSGLPVFIAEASRLESILSDETVLRPVVFNTISGADTCMCFKPDRVLVDGLPINEIYIALQNIKFSENNVYCGLINPKALPDGLF